MSTTINKEEIQKFSRLAEEWWDVSGKFKPLHMFNPIRIEYITEKIKIHFKLKKNKSNYLEAVDKFVQSDDCPSHYQYLLDNVYGGVDNVEFT